VVNDVHKTEVVVSTIAGLAVIFVGYVVWKHEMAVGAENAQANLDAQQQQVDELQSAIAALPAGVNGSYAGGSGGGSSSQSYYGTNVPDTGSSSLQSPAGYSSDLNAILAAFYPNVNAPAAATGTGATGNTPTTPPIDSTTAAQFSTSTGTAGMTYNLLLPTTLPSYTPPTLANIYH
jgi:hypothetical protein